MRGSRTRSGLKAITGPELHHRVAALFSRAVELAPAEQSSFLEEQCGSDTDLLRLLQNLLQEDLGGQLLNENSFEAMAPDAGVPDGLSERTLSHYRVISPIAVGGMGIVYRATDTRLERTVALKFCPPFLKDNQASREGFLREARAIASIDHQNVCPIYEIDEAEGLVFIAMAYLEGVTLARHIKNGPVPMAQAVNIALQAARGLQAAHAKGIVHRDIKPDNLMLVDAGSAVPLVRILDFGIAQWTEKRVLTVEGVTAGTASYMAPEQIEGARVDARADIWSLGLVLYEMLSGQPLFDGGSVREILAAIAGPSPCDLSAIRKVASSEVVAVLQRALAKDPAKRYQTAGELIGWLEPLTGAAPRRTGSTRWFWAAAALAVAVIVGIIFLLLSKSWTMPEPEALKIIPFTFYPGYQQHPAISPDSKTIAFVGQGKTGSEPLEVYVQLIGSTDPLRLTSVPAGTADLSPVWDPGATKIAFLRTHGGERFARILSVPALGGAETDLGAESVLGTGRLAWSPDGRTLAYTGFNERNEGAIFEMSLADRGIRQRSFPSPGQNDCCPQYDPSGKRLAFKRNEVEIVVLGSGREPLRALPARASWAGLTWTTDGRSLVYSWFGRLAAVNLSSGTITQPSAARALGPDTSDVTIRGNRMAYVHWNFEHSIWQLSIRHAATPSVQLIASTLHEDTPQFSPDGESIAFASERSGSTDIWVGAHDGSRLRRLTFLDGHAGTPRWSPDGKWIAFDLRPPSSKPDVCVVRASGGEPRRLANNTGGADVPSWSQNGRWIYYHSRSDGQIWKRPWLGGEAIQITRNGGFEAFESADGKYLYYSKDDNHAGIWRADLGNGKEALVPDLAEAGYYRHWALAPRGIYFVPNREAFDKNAAVRFFDFAKKKTIRVGVVGKLVTAGPGALAVSHDETALLYVHLDRDNRNVMLAENFK